MEFNLVSSGATSSFCGTISMCLPSAPQLSTHQCPYIHEGQDKVMVGVYLHIDTLLLAPEFSVHMCSNTLLICSAWWETVLGQEGI